MFTPQDYLEALQSGIAKVEAVKSEQVADYAKSPDKQDCIFLEPMEAQMLGDLIRSYKQVLNG